MQQLAACDGAELAAEIVGERADEGIDVFLAFHGALGVAVAMAGNHAERGKGSTGAAHAAQTGTKGGGKSQGLLGADAQLPGKRSEH